MFNFLIKTANSISGEDVRASKRLYIPSRRLRGFEKGKVGPVDSGDFIGGNFDCFYEAVGSFSGTVKLTFIPL